MNKSIFIDKDNDYYILSGSIDSLLQDKRVIVALQRLRYQKDDSGKLKIPIYRETQPHDESKITVLREIEMLLKRHGIEFSISESVKQENASYHQEQEQFKVFSDNAYNIREDKFSDNPALVDGFREFQEVLRKNMTRMLYPLQMLSAYHLAFSQNACNFAVPGAGKTSIVYGAYAYLKQLPAESDNKNKHVDKLLVIGPLSSFAPWENEYEECFGRKVESQRLSGDITISRGQKEQHLYSTNPKEITLISHRSMNIYEKEIIDFLEFNKTMVVVDEAHRIKNPKGVGGKSVYEIAKEAKARVVLTGTPVPNGYEDLYNLFRFLYPFKFEDILEIHHEQLKELTKNASTNDDPRVQKFIHSIKPYFIRIKKSDLKLPTPKEDIISVPMDEQQDRIYRFIKERYVKSFQSHPSATVKDILQKAKLIRLRQCATNPSLLQNSLEESLEHNDEYKDPNYDIIHSDGNFKNSDILQDIMQYHNTPQKFVAIEAIIKDQILAYQEKVIIWTIFIQNAEQLQQYLGSKSIKAKLLIGRIPQEEREDIIQKFNNPNNNDFQVVIANPFSVSESISLHKGCHNAIYMERDYNAAYFLQSKDRIHRFGLTKDIVTKYFYLVSEKSIDEVINKKLDEKVQRMEEIIDQDIPLFKRINDDDETDIITALLKEYESKMSSH